jgi:WD40 repeat protein
MRALAGTLLLALICAASATPIPVTMPTRAQAIDFAREIYPVLKRNCLACHNTTKAKANLNLETPELMAKGGDSGPAIVPGKGAESLLMKSAAHLDEDLVMPPPTNAVKAVPLTSVELGLLQTWIDEGAKGGAPQKSDGPLTWRAVAAASQPVSAVALSPAGRLAAFARGNRVDLADVTTGEVLTALKDPELAAHEPWKGQEVADRDNVMSVAFGGENLIATGGWRTVRIWRRIPQEVRRKLGALPEPATAFAATRDGRWVAVGDAKGVVRLSDSSADKSEPIILNDHETAICALAFSPDGESLISTAQDRSVSVWKVADRAVVYRSEAPAAVTALAFIRNGSEIAAAFADGFVRVWGWQSDYPKEPPSPLREFQLQAQPVQSLATINEGAQLGWLASDGALVLSDVVTGKQVRRVALELPTASRALRAERELTIAQRVVNTRKGRASAASEAVKKETENAKKQAQVMEQARLGLHRLEDALDAATESRLAQPDDKKLADAEKAAEGAFAKAERAFRAAKTNAELSARLTTDAASAYAAADVALGAAEAAAAQAQIGLEAIRKIGSEPISWSGLAISPDGKIAAVTAPDGRTRLVAVESGQIVDEVGDALYAALLRNGDSVVLGSDKCIRVSATRRSWKLERVIGQPDDAKTFSARVLAVGFSPDGRFLATGGGEPSRSGELKLWRVADGSLVRTWDRPHADTINGIAFSPDGEFLATGASDRLVRTWRISDGERMLNFEGHSGHVYSVAWRGDGLQLGSGGADQTVRLWDVLDRKLVKTTSNFGVEVNAVGFAGAGDQLFAAGGEKSVRLGDQALPDSPAYIHTAATDSLGRYIAAGGSDGTVRIWKVSDRKVARIFVAPTAGNAVTSR